MPAYRQYPRTMPGCAQVRGLALIVGALCLSAPVVANAAGPSPQASQRTVADAQLRFPLAHARYVLMDLHVAGPTTGFPADQGYLDTALRLCTANSCDAPATYRQSLTASQFTAAQNASTASLMATVMGVPLRLTWSSDADYQAHPTLVINRGAVSGGAGGYVIVPADRYADAAGQANKRSCHAREAILSYEAIVGTPEADAFTNAPSRLPSRFQSVQRAACG